MKSDKERALAAELFGTVDPRPIRAAGGYKPILRDLTAGLEWDQGVIFVFCCGCGTLGEADMAGAKRLAKQAGKSLPDNLAVYYFETNGCECCDADMSIVTLRKIIE